MEAAQAARVAIATNEDYKGWMDEMSQEIAVLLKGKNIIVRENWDWLKEISGRGK